MFSSHLEKDFKPLSLRFPLPSEVTIQAAMLSIHQDSTRQNLAHPGSCRAQSRLSATSEAQGLWQGGPALSCCSVHGGSTVSLIYIMKSLMYSCSRFKTKQNLSSYCLYQSLRSWSGKKNGIFFFLKPQIPKGNTAVCSPFLNKISSCSEMVEAIQMS